MEIRFAKHRFRDKILHIDQVESGLRCGCVCIECNGLLQAIHWKGQDYFRHNNITDCRGAQESVLHKIVKQIICEHKQIKISESITAEYSSAVQEKSLGDYIPDVTVISNGEEIHFEIYVTNPVNTAKKQFYVDSNFKCVEIDAREALNSNMSYKELKHWVINAIRNKRIINWEKENLPVEVIPVVQWKNKEPELDFITPLFKFLGLALLFLILKSLLSNRR